MSGNGENDREGALLFLQEDFEGDFPRNIIPEEVGRFAIVRLGDVGDEGKDAIGGADVIGFVGLALLACLHNLSWKNLEIEDLRVMGPGRPFSRVLQKFPPEAVVVVWPFQCGNIEFSIAIAEREMKLEFLFPFLLILYLEFVRIVDRHMRYASELDIKNDADALFIINSVALFV